MGYECAMKGGKYAGSQICSTHVNFLKRSKIWKTHEKNIKKCTVNYCDDLRKCSWNHLEATWWQLLKAWPPRFSCFSGEPWRWINKSLNSTKNMTWRSSNQHKYVDVQKKVRGLLQPPIPPSFRNQSTGFARSRRIWLPEVCPTTWRAFHPPNPQVAAASSSP